MFLTGILRGKLYALWIGTAGVGIVGQLSGFLSFASTYNLLGLGVGASKYIAESHHAGDAKRVKSIVATCLTLTGGLSILSTILFVLLSERLSVILFHTHEYRGYVTMASLAVAFLVGTQILMNFLYGFKEVRRGSAASILASIGSLILVALLLYRYQVRGAVYGILLAAVLGFVVSAVLFYQAHKDLFLDFSLRPDLSLARSLATIGGASLIMGTSDQLVLLFMRSTIIGRFGIESNGLYQVAYLISQQTALIASMFISTYAFPKMSGLRELHQINDETNQVIRLLLFLFVPAIGLVLFFKKYLILLFLSPAFLPSAPLFQYQLLGELFKGLGIALVTGILQVASVRVWFGLGMAWALSLLGAFLVTSPLLGFESAVIAYAIAALIYFLLCLFAMQRYSHFVPSRENVALFLRSLLLLLLAVRLSTDTPTSCLIGIALIGLWARWAVSHDECQRALQFVRAHVWK